MKKCSFRKKITRALLLFSALLILVMCTTVGTYYKHQEMHKYGELAYSFARMAADYIDGDRVTGYVETGEKDDYYEQVLSFLNCTQEETDVLYYYVFIPYEDDLVYVWDAENEEGACALGYREQYMEGGREDSFRAMAGNIKNEITVTNDATYGYIGSAYYPIYDHEGKSVALVGVDISMPDIQTNMIYFITVIITCIVFVIAVFIVLLYLFLNKVFINPINQLNDAAKNMVSNLESEDEIRIGISTGDEIQELADSYSKMYVEVKDYIRKIASITAEKERITAELDVAQKIQADILPCIFPAFPDRDEFDIYATMTPAKEVGGDFYDFFFVDDDHLAMVIADVSGKGIPAALFMMISKALIKSAVLGGVSPKEALEQVNNQLCENNQAEMFVTVWLGILEISTGKMVCSNAGHEYPTIKRKDGVFELLRDKHDFVLAGMEGIAYREYELEFHPGDVIFVYTDGLAEATNENGELYGTDRILQALNSSKCETCKEILDGVHEKVNAFMGNAPQFDDITMLCVWLADQEMDRNIL